MGSISRRHRSDGEITYMARVLRAGHPNLTATFKRRTDAVEWLKAQESKILGGRTTVKGAPRLPTVQDAIDRYLSENECDVNRWTHLSRWATALGTVPFRRLNYSAIKEAMGMLRAAPGRTPDGHLSPSSMRVHLCSLSIVCKLARRLGWIDSNPVDDVESFPQSAVRVRHLNQEELTSLLDACKKSNYKPLYLIVLLALSTGMRKQEILSLKWKQVDLNRACLVLYHTKNGMRRSAPLTGKPLALLRARYASRNELSDFVFPGEKPSPEKTCNAKPSSERHFDVTAPWTRARQEAGITDFRFHDLRHTTASYLAMNGASLIEIAGVLGHKQLQTVHRYAHLSDDHLGEVVESMSIRFLNF